MKRALVFMALLLAAPAFCFAQPKEQPEAMNQTASGEMKNCPQMKGKPMAGCMGDKDCRCPQCGAKCGMMMGARSAAIAASDNGSVIVLKGHKLYKYDKDLNLVKSAEVGETPQQEQSEKQGEEKE